MVIELPVPGTSKGKGKKKTLESQTLIEALARAIDGTDKTETLRLAKGFNQSLGHVVRASVGVESVKGGDSVNPPETSGKIKSRNLHTEQEAHVLSAADRVEVEEMKRKKDDSPPSSDTSGSEKAKKKKKKSHASKKKNCKQLDDFLCLSGSSDSSSSTGDSLTDFSEAEDAELCYEVTDFESADLPDLPDKWDKNFRKLRSYVPLSLFKTSLLDSYYNDEVEQKTKDKSDLLKSLLKAAERRLTYGDFIEMCDLEEPYAREIYGLNTYTEYIVKHKKIVSDLKKSYNCWIIGLWYHLIKVWTVIFCRRKLIKSKVKGRTVMKDKVKIPNGLQLLVKKQARHEADQAGDSQHVDNPYAIGGVKFGFNFHTGRAQVSSRAATVAEKPADHRNSPGQAIQQGRRAGISVKSYVKRENFNYFRGQRPSYLDQQQENRSLYQPAPYHHAPYHHAPYHPAPVNPPSRPFYQNKNPKKITGSGPQKGQATEGQAP